MPPAIVPAAPLMTYDEKLQEVLKRFGIARLKPRQIECIEARVAGKDVLAVLPTSYGKSACYQIPGIVLGEATLVISPLIALQEDQVRKLRSLGYKAFAYHSGLDMVRKAAVHYYFKTAPKGEPSFLYISPELLLKETFHNRFAHIRFDHIAVDEAHCVSTWGDAFRPEYQRIRLAVSRLKIPNCSAFTATTDPKIERDIMERIPLREGYVKIEEEPYRPNLILKVERLNKVSDSTNLKGAKKTYRLLELLRAEEFNGPTVVYYNSINGSAGLYQRLREKVGFFAKTGYTPHLFHAMLPNDDKVSALKGFLREKKPLMIATSAFGMGIDRADIRQVIHYKTPFGLVDYAQQFGRGGRDGLPTLCTTFHTVDDESEGQIDAGVNAEIPRFETVEKVHHHLRKRVLKLNEKERKTYNLATYVRSQVHLIERNSEIRNPPATLRRFQTAIAFLQRSKLVWEGENGIEVRPLIPGDERHLALIELTQMHQRRLMRERRRVAEFFGSPKPTQKLLWKMIKET